METIHPKVRISVNSQIVRRFRGSMTAAISTLNGADITKSCQSVAGSEIGLSGGSSSMPQSISATDTAIAKWRGIRDGCGRIATIDSPVLAAYNSDVAPPLGRLEDRLFGHEHLRMKRRILPETSKHRVSDDFRAEQPKSSSWSRLPCTDRQSFHRFRERL